MPTVTVQQAFELAFQHQQAGRLADAEVLYRQILAVQPDHADALHSLGVIAHKFGRHDIAAKLIERALAVGSANPAAHANLGEVYRAAGRIDEAILEYRRAIELKPDFPEPHANLGLALAALGRIDEAILAQSRAIELNPQIAEIHNNLGTVLAQRDRFDEAIASYRRALVLKPDYADVFNNLGNVLKDRAQLNEAAAAYQRAIEIAPHLADAHYNLANVLREFGRFDESVAGYRRTLAHQPQHLEAHINLGNVLMELGQLDEAIGEYRRALQLQPGDARAASNLIYLLQFHPGTSGGVLVQEQTSWNRRFGDSVQRFILPQANHRDAERPIRIGYVSPDFRAHVVGWNLLPLFRHHDRTQFEVVCYSGVTHPDRLTKEFRQHADHWRSTVKVADEQFAEMIQGDRVDILVDLTQHMAGNRLPVFTRKPAPLQLSFAGYPASTGLETIDYRISDRWLESEIEQRCESELRTAEQVIRIDSFWCYDPCGMEVEVNGLPAKESNRITFGSLNNFCKVNEALLKCWARILSQVRDSSLTLLSPLGDTRRWTLELLRRQGIDGQRVTFVERQERKEYLERYHRLDIALDPFPYGGHTTSLDALWMGVPVVSLAGQTSVSRAGLSILSNLGLPELVAFSEDDYVRIAVELAENLPRLVELRTTLRSRMEASVLMDAPHFARQIEAAYRAVWRQWCAAEKS